MQKRATKKKATAKPRKAPKKIDPTFQLVRGLLGNLESRVVIVEQALTLAKQCQRENEDTVLALVRRVDDAARTGTQRTAVVDDVRDRLQALEARIEALEAGRRQPGEA